MSIYKGIVSVDGKILEVNYQYMSEDEIYCWVIDTNRTFYTHYKSLVDNKQIVLTKEP